MIVTSQIRKCMLVQCFWNWIIHSCILRVCLCLSFVTLMSVCNSGSIWSSIDMHQSWRDQRRIKKVSNWCRRGLTQWPRGREGRREINCPKSFLSDETNYSDVWCALVNNSGQRLCSWSGTGLGYIWHQLGQIWWWGSRGWRERWRDWLLMEDDKTRGSLSVWTSPVHVVNLYSTIVSCKL